jgi:hypothetical protein
MHDIIMALKVGISTGFGMIVGQVVPVDSSYISVTAACGVTIFVSTLIYFLTDRLRRLEDKIKDVADDLKKRPCQWDKCSVQPPNHNQ